MSADTSSPYYTTGPTLLSFSGGRTSAFMLYETIRAHGGTLPEHVVVAFANTGKEREETLRFFHECGSRWGVRIRWLKWRREAPGFEEVGFNSASRNGEPFAALIRKRSYTPNAVTRFCTSELKVRVIRDFCRSLGWDHWQSMIGLRYDEGRRVLKQIANNEVRKERWISIMPMAAVETKITHREVLAFWLGDNVDPKSLAYPLPQGFDLGLWSFEGNCDLCFLKSRAKLLRVIRDNPASVAWWKQGELDGKGRFVTEYSYADLEREVRSQPFMPGLLDDDEEYDAECGLTCGADA